MAKSEEKKDFLGIPMVRRICIQCRKKFRTMRLNYDLRTCPRCDNNTVELDSEGNIDDKN